MPNTNNTDTIMDPIHPGEVLLEDYLTPLGITQHKLAIAIFVPPRRINEIVRNGQQPPAAPALSGIDSGRRQMRRREAPLPA